MQVPDKNLDKALLFSRNVWKFETFDEVQLP